MIQLPLRAVYDSEGKVSSIRVDGYPDAGRLGIMRGQRARRFASLNLHRAVLEDCLVAMNGSLLITEENSIVVNAILTGVVTKFFSCFGRNSISAPLVATKIFGAQPQAMQCFEHWKAIRDSHIAHDESKFSQADCFVVMKPDGTFLDVICTVMRVDFASDKGANQTLFDLIRFTLDWVRRALDDAHESLNAEASSMSNAARLQLDEAKYTAPTSPKDQRSK